MSVKVERKHLQTGQYKYTWNRDDGDSPYTGKLDRIKIDKDEGYEVIYFIKTLMDKHGLKKLADVHRIEDALHDDDLSSVVLRKKLIEAIELELDL